MKKKPGIIAVFVVNLIILLILWSILELISYFVYRHIPLKFANGKRIVEINLGHKTNDEEVSIIPHPYLLYANNPLHRDSVLQHNSLGYRGPEFTIEKDSNTLRILTLGGSTTYGYLNKNPLDTWSAQLQSKLQKITSQKVEVINGGINYGTSAELLASYVFRHRYIHPDIVIFHEGGNDAFATLFPEYNAEYTHFRANGNSPKLRPGEYLLLHSNVFKLFYAVWLNQTSVVYSSQPFGCELLKKSEVQARIMDTSNYEGFRRNVDLLIRLLKQDGSKICIVGFLNAPNKIIKISRPDLNLITDEYLMATDKNNNILKSLSQLHQVEYIHLDPGLFRDEWFLDNCHLNKYGEEKKAEVVFTHLKAIIK